MSDIDPRAIRAATRAAYKVHSTPYDFDTWEMAEGAEIARAALEAAAPFMCAKAWNEGRLDAQMAPPGQLPTNPYQGQAPTL